MSIGEHLEELRMRLGRCVLALAAAFFVCLAFRDQISDVIMGPHRAAAAALAAEGIHMPEALQALSYQEPVFYYLRMALYGALFLSSPVILWQMWAFIGAGLYRKERRVVLRFVPLSLVLLAGAVSFGYFVFIPFGLRMLTMMSEDLIRAGLLTYTPKLAEYFSLFVSLTLALGIVFQIPVVMQVLSRVGMVGPKAWKTGRRYFIAGAFLLAAMLTPPDVVTQVMMGIPMLLLYELGIWLSVLADRKRTAQEQATA